MEHATNKLKAHPEHWHMMALCRAMEDLQAWVVELLPMGNDQAAGKAPPIPELMLLVLFELSSADATGGDAEDSVRANQSTEQNEQEDLQEDLSMQDEGGS